MDTKIAEYGSAWPIAAIGAFATGVAVPAAAAQPGSLEEASLVPREAAGPWSLFNPRPRGSLRELSTDRPDTTESPFTVDAGHFQLELSFVDYTYNRRNQDQVTSETLAVAPMLLKVGLLNNVDLQLGLDPYTRVKEHDRITNQRESADGFGDVLTRLKINLWGNDTMHAPGDTSLAIMPFMKFPAADSGEGGLGNGNIEGGLIVPLAIQLPDEWSLGLMIEIDLNRSAADDRYVVDLVHTATVAHAIIGELGGYIEYAGFANLNQDELYRGYIDAGLTYGLTDNLQLDGGVRVGLTEAADDFGIFAGVSYRY